MPDRERPGPCGETRHVGDVPPLNGAWSVGPFPGDLRRRVDPSGRSGLRDDPGRGGMGDLDGLPVAGGLKTTLRPVGPETQPSGGVPGLRSRDGYRDGFSPFFWPSERSARRVPKRVLIGMSCGC